MAQTGAPLVYACQLSPENIGQVHDFLVRYNLQLHHNLMERCEPGDYILLSLRTVDKKPRSAQPLTQNAFATCWSWSDAEAFGDIFRPIRYLVPTIGAR